MSTTSSTVVVESTGVESDGETTYYAVVATYTETVETVETTDAEVSASQSVTYSATTQKINYQDFVSGYTMPFDYLWVLLVLTEDKDFVMELADLVYDSEIEITIHDNLNVHTKVDTYDYTRREKVQTVNTTVEVQYERTSEDGNTYNSRVQYSRSNFDPVEYDTVCQTTVTTVTTTNTLDIALTKADVWIVDYEQDYTYSSFQKVSESTDTSSIDDVDYGSDYETIYTDRNGDAKQFAVEKAMQVSSERELADVSSDVVSVECHVWDGVFEISETITNTTEKSEYVKGADAEPQEKTDKNSDEPNFVTILLSNLRAKHTILDAPQWLFDLLEGNESTADTFVDLTKYLLYKATGKDYGVTEFDFDTLFYSGSLTSVGSDDYIVDTTKSSQDIVITDLDTLKQAFSWYSRDEVLQEYAYYFLECQEKYNVNAVFAAAVSITESSAGTNVAIGGNNMFSISNGGQGNWNSYSTMENSIEAFFSLISEEYFTNDQYTVDSIARGNPEGSHMYCVPPDDWIEDTCDYMTQMFNAAGINVTSFSGSDIVSIAKQCHDYLRTNGYRYSMAYNKSIPIDENSDKVVDCSSFVSWVLYEYGYTELAGAQQTTQTLYTLAVRKGWTIKSGSEAQAGDILLNPSSHTAIYAGNNQSYDCGSDTAIQSEIKSCNPASFQYSITVTKP